jgi:hypothetical protein
MKRSSNDKGANNVGEVYQTRSCDLPSGLAGSDVGNRECGCDDFRQALYWPSEVGPSAYRAVNTQHAPHDAFAAIGQTSESSGPRYLGGPKSGLIASLGEFAHTHPGGR